MALLSASVRNGIRERKISLSLENSLNVIDYPKIDAAKNTNRGRNWRYIGWWEEIVPQFTSDDWIENFRMNKSTFEYICKELNSELKPKFNQLQPREPVDVRKQVAIGIFLYASSCEYRVVAHLFGLHTTTVRKHIHRVTKAINNKLMPKWITMPNEIACRKISNEFEKITGMPNFIGAIDGRHIPIRPPSDGYRDFINRKGWASYVLQGLVDNNLM
ncbi:putative nuclease HARBI1 [Leptopilina boulardi]|uniref:putative nuclease HARBI1 n=1 Tax=Leptopilina boulardi TaxID=63433 RepID=UPI0021F60133|nr:putative nuclease HARBI1 [Leptopilina boulardi]